MDFKTYWTGMRVPERKAFAARVGASPNYLNLYAFGQKPRLGESIAIGIERESAGAVTCEELRPDVDWAYLRGTCCEEKVSPAATAAEKEAA